MLSLSGTPSRGRAVVDLEGSLDRDFVLSRGDAEPENRESADRADIEVSSAEITGRGYKLYGAEITDLNAFSQTMPDSDPFPSY
jgi:hypothetical protein